MDPLPIVCSLGTDGLANRRQEWSAVLARATTRASIPGGVAIHFPAGAELTDTIAGLIAKEEACCAWMSMKLRPAGSEQILSITNGEALGERQILEWFG